MTARCILLKAVCWASIMKMTRRTCAWPWSVPAPFLGEGAFFSHHPRSATVQASGPCKLWCLTPVCFIELGNRHSLVALELVMAIGAVMARRLYSRSKRVAVT